MPRQSVIPVSPAVLVQSRARFAGRRRRERYTYFLKFGVRSLIAGILVCPKVSVQVERYSRYATYRGAV